MNPLPRTTPTQQGASGGTTIIVGGGSGIPYHTHPAAAITGDLNDILPERLQELAHRNEVDDLNAVEALRSGWWSADTLTLNTPASSFWVGRSSWYGIDIVSGYFGAQEAQEIVPPYRLYRRTLNTITWTAWEQVDRTFLDTRYRLMTDDVSLTTEVSGILPIANGGTGTATPTKVLSGTTTVSLVAASSGFNTVTFSSAFAAAPVVTVTTENADYFGATAVRTTADARIYVSHRNTTNATISVVACWVAVGT